MSAPMARGSPPSAAERGRPCPGGGAPAASPRIPATHKQPCGPRHAVEDCRKTAPSTHNFKLTRMCVAMFRHFFICK